MAIGTATAIGLGLAGIGGLMNARSQNKAAKQQTQSNAQNRQWLTGMMQNNPGASEAQIQAMLAGFQPTQVGPGPDGVTAQQITAPQVMTPGLTPEMAVMGFSPERLTDGFDPTQASNTFAPELVSSSFNPDLYTHTFQGEMSDMKGALDRRGFNTGQDAIMQMLRADPRTKVDQTLTGIMENNGDMFDTSELFRSLGVLDTERVNSQIADFRGGYGSLGQRFGSAAMTEDAQLRRGAANDAAARNAQIAMQSWEAGKARQMGAAQQLTGREQFGQDLRLRGGAQLQTAANQAAQTELAGISANNQTNLSGEQLRLAGIGSNNSANQIVQELIFQAANQNNSANAQRQSFDLQANQQNNQFGLGAAELALATGQANNQSGLAAAQLAAQVTGQNNQANLAAANLDLNANMANQQAALSALANNQQAALQAAQGNQQVAVQMQQLALQAQQGDRQAQMQLMQLMAQLEQSRTAGNQNLAFAAAGLNPVAGPGYGSVVGDLGTAVMLGGAMSRNTQPRTGIRTDTTEF